MARSYIQARLKRAKFFDRVVTSAVSKAHKQALSKFGAFVRSDARKSMRTARARKTVKNTIGVYRPRFRRDNQEAFVEEGGRRIRVTRTPSKPGTPPRAVLGHIKRFLFFEYEDSRGPNVVIGPWRLPSRTVTRHPVPAIHEQRKPQHAYVTRRRRRAKYPTTFKQWAGNTVQAKYPQRPYMVPAFNKNQRKVRGLYRDVVKRR